jgi:methylmalonyl-CoA/ethylmalonyl-CoA epimerase
MRFDHAGIATDDAEGLAFRYEELFGCEIAHEERLDGLHVIFLGLGNGYFELLEPTDDGTIASYLDSHGPGLHHVAVETADIEAAIETAAAAGAELIDDEPRPGAWGHEIAFLHPDSTGGALIEFVEH